jgi:hypothetical protein
LNRHDTECDTTLQSPTTASISAKAAKPSNSDVTNHSRAKPALASAPSAVRTVQVFLETPSATRLRVNHGLLKSHRSSLVHDLCDADVFRPVCVGQNSQSLVLYVVTGAVVGEAKKHRLTPSCI